ncbi:MAG: permease-like cell division protein FtsX, partial [Acutalibacteraceae bacterium]
MKIRSFGYLIKEGIKNTWTNRIMSLASVGVLISCLVLTGAAALVTMNVSRAVEAVGESNVTTVYLDGDIGDLEAVFIGKDISKIKNITEVEFFSKEEAIKDYRDVLGDDVFAEMQGDNNPLPNAFKVTMADLSKYDKTVDKIKGIEGVDTVSSVSDVANKLTTLNKLISILSIAVIIALAIISLFIIANTIRMTMYSR